MTTVPTAIDRSVHATKFSIPQTTNVLLAALHISLNIFQLFILPLYFVPRNIRWSLLLIPIAGMSNPCWALIHEAIHDLLHSSTRVNLAIGRWLSIFFGSPFHVLRLTHLSHHKFNRSPLEKGTEIYDPAELSRLKAGFGYYCYILCGLYLLEVFSTFLFLLPPTVFRKLRRRAIDSGNIQEKWLAAKFVDPKLIRETRIDGLAIGLIFGLSVFLYRGHLLIFSSVLMARTFLISFLDNVYHYRTRLHMTISGHNLWLPRVLSGLLLHFNMHRVHHAHPSVPWPKLPEIFARESESFDRNLFAAAIDQLHGPLPELYLAGIPPKARQQTLSTVRPEDE